MFALTTFKISLLLSLLSNLNSALLPLPGVGKNIVDDGLFPPTCTRIECPNFEIIHQGNGFEIRRYNHTEWIETSPIQEISLVQATRQGFLQLFDYIQGKNEYQQEIEMTAPVLTKVSPGDGPLCESTFSISFYIPKQNQANPPPAEGLHVRSWKPIFAAVRQFSGFVTDSNVGEEAAALQASLVGTVWGDAIAKSQGAGATSGYTVAQYNSPFEFENRVNEIWFLFDM
ncbi:hypothetical protein SLA2020_001950 [Shorea laevis]